MSHGALKNLNVSLGVIGQNQLTLSSFEFGCGPASSRDHIDEKRIYQVCGVFSNAP
jgi:hypothetical protein